MTSDGALVFLAGVLSGGVIGYVQAWRLARRLEYFRVSLADWQTEDIDAPKRTTALRVARDA